MLLRALYKCFLNTDRNETLNRSFKNLFQCLTTIIVKKYFHSEPPLVQLYIIPSCSAIGDWERLAPPSALPLLRELQKTTWNPLFQLDKPSVVSLSSPEMPSSAFIRFVVLLWMFYSNLIGFVRFIMPLFVFRALYLLLQKWSFGFTT